MLFHISELAAVSNVWMNDFPSGPFKCSQALMNEVVTNNLLRRVATQVYLEDIDLTLQPGEISQPYSKFHRLPFRYTKQQ